MEEWNKLMTHMQFMHSVADYCDRFQLIDGGNSKVDTVYFSSLMGGISFSSKFDTSVFTNALMDYLKDKTQTVHNPTRIVMKLMPFEFDLLLAFAAAMLEKKRGGRLCIVSNTATLRKIMKSETHDVFEKQMYEFVIRNSILIRRDPYKMDDFKMACLYPNTRVECFSYAHTIVEKTLEKYIKDLKYDALCEVNFTDVASYVKRDSFLEFRKGDTA